MTKWVASQFDDEQSGLSFMFSHENNDRLAALHITVRHQTTPEEAIATFLREDAVTVWNEKRLRFETTTDTHVLYWAWYKPGDKVLVITCARREE
jgi:hypothetical protein